MAKKPEKDKKPAAEEKKPAADTGSGEEKKPAADTGSGEEKKPAADTGSGEEKKPAADTGSGEEKKPAADAGPAKAGGAEEAQAITINAQFIKDLSFEAPAAPGIFSLLQESPPDINVNINVSANPLQDRVFEVIIEFRAECKVKEQVAFILELEYAGVFTLNVPEEHLQPILLIECPRLLFPFARNILADVSRDGGFPPLMLGPVDFAALFQNQIQELQKAQAAGGEAPPAPSSPAPSS